MGASKKQLDKQAWLKSLDFISSKEKDVEKQGHREKEDGTGLEIAQQQSEPQVAFLVTGHTANHSGGLGDCSNFPNQCNGGRGALRVWKVSCCRHLQ